MVQTRSGLETKRNSNRLTTGALLAVSALVAAVVLSAAYVAFENFEHKAHSVLHRSHYSFGGAQGQASNYWQQVPSWEDVKGYAADTKAFPEPSLWQHTKSIVTRKPIRQVQAEDAYGATKQAANDYAESGKQTYEDSKQAASDYAGSAQQAAQDGYEATKDTTLSLSDKVRTKLFGLKTAAEKETSRQRRLAVEAQWRAEYESKQGWWEKFKHIVFGPAKLPSTQHYDNAASAGGKAYDHSANAASEAYEAAKDAAAGIAHGARGAARSAAGAGTVAKDMGGRAAGSASDAATDAYNSDTAKTAAEYARAAKARGAQAGAAAGQHGSAAYDATAGATGNAAQYAKDAANAATGNAGLTAEQIKHRAQEAAQRATHRMQEAAHRAHIEL